MSDFAFSAITFCFSANYKSTINIIISLKMVVNFSLVDIFKK